MKQKCTLFFLLLLFFSSSLFSQPTTHPFELGINGGGSWLSSDVRMGKLGGGFGLTFGQTYGMNKKNMLTFGWRLRFLDANAFGQDYRRSYGLKNNEVLNGTLDSSMNYAASPGYVYQNYKTHLDEFSLEGVLSFNQAVYYVYPYIFGGVGLTRAVARTNQLDADGLPYDYSGINQSGADGKLAVLNQLHALQDNSYETLAEGNRSPSWKFMPSAGVGIGFELAPAVSIGLEYKLTWARNDVLEGQRWTNTNTPTAHNDLYHYANIWLKLDFGRGTGSKHVSNTTEPVVTNPPVPVMPLPVISISNPPAPNLATDQPLLVLAGKVYNIGSVNDMHIAVNGVPASGYFYDPSTQDFSFAVQLAPGLNTFDISATNASGTVNAATNLTFALPVVSMPPPPMPPPPVVEIREPYHNPEFTNDATVSVRGTALYINSGHELQVTVNGFEEHGVSFNPATHTFTINAHLVEGANTFVITATNPSGSDTKATTVISKSAGTGNLPPPRIILVSPAMNPYSTISDMISVSATVQHVDLRSGITLITNGVANNSFIFDPRSGSLAFSMHLVHGNNTVHIQAVNPVGSDVKDLLIVYAPPIQPSEMPRITVTTPMVNPFTTISNTAAVTATVEHVTSLSQIAVTLNAAPVAAAHLGFVPSTHQLSFNANLVPGNNTVTITATNSAGSDSKTQTIIRSGSPGGTVAKPVVTFVLPASNPFNTPVNPQPVIAGISNISSASEVTATVNGNAISAAALNYSMASHQLSFNASLVNGANTVTVTATNAGGTDSKSTTVIYTPPPVVPKPVITMILPATTPYLATAAATAIEASVMNITGVPDIGVTLNGAALPAGTLNYNAASHQLFFNVNLNAGMNTLLITATNASGSDSKTVMLKLPSPTVVLSKPMITITSPAANPYSTNAAGYTMTATIVGVEGVTGISVMLNGHRVSTGAWTYNAATQQFSYPVSLNPGTNTIELAASNTAGSISGTQVITRNSGPVTTTPRPAVTAPHTAVPATTTPSTTTPATTAPPRTTTPAPRAGIATGEPEITLVTPASGADATTDGTYTIVATILNVSAASGISVTVNGTGLRGSSFDAVSGRLTAPVPLSNGTNVVIIHATNGSGSKQQKVIITKN